jgi:putative ABC transport system permease protein
VSAPGPPRWAERLLARLLPNGADSALGDLAEEYAERARRGRGWPRAFYLREALDLARAFALERLRRCALPMEAARPRKGDPMLETAWQEARFAARSLVRRPAFTALVVATLGLGIGGNVALFSVVDGVLLRPLPYREPERLVVVWQNDRRRGTEREGFSQPDYADLVAMNRSFEATAARARLDRVLGTADEPVRVASARVSAAFFPLLGIRPLLGRGFLAEEETPGRDLVLVLGEGLWRERFAADPGVLGRRIRLDGELRTIVGVVPREARMPGLGDEIFEPLAFAPNEKFRGIHKYRVIARLAPGVSVESAQADAASVMRQLERLYPDDNEGRGAWVRPLDDESVGAVRPALRMLYGAVGLLLMMACASAANLTLARGMGRERELAIRSSLGSSPFGISRLLFVENLLLSLAGGAAGIGLAAYLVGLLRRYGPADLPRLGEVAVDARALGYALALALGSALFAGILPALRGARSDPRSALHAGGRLAGAERRRPREAFAALSLGVAVVLVLGAGLLGRSFWKLRQVDPGFRTESLLLAQVDLPGSSYPFPKKWPVLSWPEYDSFETRLEERLAADPRVASFALAHQGPTDGGWTTRVTVEGRPAPPPGQQDEASFRPVSARYFETLGVPLRRGRAFGSEDGAGRPAVAVVNDAFVRRHFADEQPLERAIVVFGVPRRIVGVVGDERFEGLDADPAPAMYLPIRQSPQPALRLILRARGEAAVAAPVLRAALRAVDPGLALYGVGTGEEALASGLAQRRLTLQLLSAFAAVALLLSVVGVYGVVSYLVAERTREMGVRIALGAEPGHVFGLVVARGMALAGLAVGAGCAAGLALGRVMEGLLYGVDARDPLTFASVGAVLLATSFLASALPARRATRVDPIVALRSE